METKIFSIRTEKKDNLYYNSSQIVDSENIFYNYTFKNLITPTWTLRDDNYTGVSVGSDGDSGLLGSVCIHDDLIISGGLGDGFGIRRVNDDGSIDTLFTDSSPAGSSYSHNVAIDKENYKAYVCAYNTSYVAVFDYSEALPTPYLVNPSVVLFYEEDAFDGNLYDGHTSYANGLKFYFNNVDESVNAVRIRINAYDAENAYVGLNGDTLGQMVGPDQATMDFFFYSDNINYGANNNEISFWAPSSEGMIIYEIEVQEWSRIIDTGNITKTTLTKAGNDLPAIAFGDTHWGGTIIIGDYFYGVPYSETFTSMKRWKISTQTKESIPVDNYQLAAQYGHLTYDKENNRLYILWRSNGGIWVILNPDGDLDNPSNAPECYCLNTNHASISIGDDCYGGGVVADNDNPNILYVSVNQGRYAKIDITNILNGTSTYPELLDSHELSYRRTLSMNSAPYWMAGYSSLLRNSVFGSDFIYINPDRSYYQWYGWLDTKNFRPVGGIRPSYSIYDDYGGYIYEYTDRTSLRFDYAGEFHYIESDGGVGYWIHAGYGGLGYKFRSWAASEHPNGFCLEDNAYITFGTYELDNGNDIGQVRISNLIDQLYIPNPSVDIFSCYVSNDNGSSWEEYDYENEEDHEFSSTGSQVQVKFEFEGPGSSAPYIDGIYPINISIMEKQTVNTAYFKGFSSFNIKG